MNAKQITPAQAFENTLTNEKMHSKLSSVMPSHMNINTFISSAIKYCISNPKIMKTNRDSLYNAIFDAAKAGMLIDGRESFINIYGNMATWQTQYRGNAKRAGFKKYGAILIHEGDTYSASMGIDGADFSYTMARESRGKLQIAMAWAVDHDGFKRLLEIPASRIDQIKGRYGPGWKKDECEFIKKHVINVMSKHVIDPGTDSTLDFEESEIVDQNTGEINITPAPKPTPQLTAAQIAVQATMESMAEEVLETANEYQQAQNAD